MLLLSLCLCVSVKQDHETAFRSSIEVMGPMTKSRCPFSVDIFNMTCRLYQNYKILISFPKCHGDKGKQGNKGIFGSYVLCRK